MAFLNNSGDIIVDAVLTDVGRQLLANGRNIVSKFALADTEIDYALYDSNNVSGSSYYDINILQTPILEPSTLSQGSLESRLFSYPNNSLVYLPVLKLNQSNRITTGLTTIDNTYTKAINVLASDSIISTIGTSVIASDTTMIDGRRNVTSTLPTISTARSGNRVGGVTSRFIRVSQGFDNSNVTIPLGQLEETSFSIYVNRLFLKVVDKNYAFKKQPSVVASSFSRTQATDIYKLSTQVSSQLENVPLLNVGDSSYFGDIETYQVNNSTSLATSLAASTLEQVGKEIQFSLQLSDFLASNPSYYFTTYGTSYTGNIGSSASVTATVISTTVRVVGDNYGFAIDIPVKLFYL